MRMTNARNLVSGKKEEGDMQVVPKATDRKGGIHTTALFLHRALRLTRAQESYCQFFP